jgi:photosystem II stability/assembly factor-like uncharacterized protein
MALAGLMLGLTVGLASAAGTWQSIGTDGGLVQQLATASVSPTVIYARTGSRFAGQVFPWLGNGSGIWKSTDGGATWQTTAVGVDDASGDHNAELQAMAVSADGQTVYAASPPSAWPAPPYSRIWRSTDGGASWTSTKVPTSTVPSLAIFSNGRVVAGSAQNNDRPLFYSDDGTTWNLATTTPYTQASIFTLAEGGSMYAGGEADVTGGGTWHTAVYTSTDGITWTCAFTHSTWSNFVQIVADPSDANRAYALLGSPVPLQGQVYSTTNRGQTWAPLALQPCFPGGGWTSAIAVDGQGRLYAAATCIAGPTWQHQIRRSTNHGGSWGLLGETAGGNPVNTIVVDPNDDSVVYFGSDDLDIVSEGVCRTPASYHVGAASLELGLANSNLRAYRVNSVAGLSDTVYAATRGQGVIKSTDGGQTWSRASEGLATWADVVAVHPSDGDIAYFVGGRISPFGIFPYQLYRTEDGVVWEQRDTGLPLGFFGNPIIDLDINPATPAELYAVWHAVGWGGIVFTTTNSGQNWAVLATLAATPTSAIAIHPTAPQNVYAACDTTPISPTGNMDAIYKSTDGGGSWLPLPAGISCTLDVLVNPVSPTHVYATACDGTFAKSTNDGGVWTTAPISPGLSFPLGARPGRLAYDSEQDVIYAALGPYGLFASDDGGQTWSQVTGDDIPSMGMLSLYHEPQSGDLYLGGSAGLWRREGITRVFLPVVLRNYSLP